MLKDLKTHHREVGRLSFQGFKPAEIAKKTDIKLTTVYTILRDPMCKAFINGLMDKADEVSIDVREKLVSMNNSALDAIGDILDKNTKAPHNVILNAAKDVLDRNGYKPPDKTHINLDIQNKSDEELDAQIAAIEEQLKITAKTTNKDQS